MHFATSFLNFPGRIILVDDLYVSGRNGGNRRELPHRLKCEHSFALMHAICALAPPIQASQFNRIAHKRLTGNVEQMCEQIQLSNCCRGVKVIGNFLLAVSSFLGTSTHIFIECTMLVAHVFGRLKSLLLGILALIRRALCCFSRRRKRSNSECEILNSVSVVQSDGNHCSTKHRNDVSICWLSSAACVSEVSDDE